MVVLFFVNFFFCFVLFCWVELVLLDMCYSVAAVGCRFSHALEMLIHIKRQIDIDDGRKDAKRSTERQAAFFNSNSTSSGSRNIPKNWEKKIPNIHTHRQWSATILWAYRLSDWSISMCEYNVISSEFQFLFHFQSLYGLQACVYITKHCIESTCWALDRSKYTFDI